MFEYALHQLRHDDLLRRAEHERQVRQALRLRRTTRRDAAPHNTEAESHTWRHRFPRAA
jgi:hypothetical protein